MINPRCPRLSSRRFVAFCALLWVPVVFAEHVVAQAESPPVLSVTTDRETYRFGEPIVVRISARNTSPEGQDYRPISLGKGVTCYVLQDADGRRMEPLIPPTTGGWVVSEHTVTPPGGAVISSSVLDLIYGPIQPGDYSLSVGYPITERIPVSVGEVEGYRIRIVDCTWTGTEFTVSAPAQEYEAAAEALTELFMRGRYGLSVPPSEETLRSESFPLHTQEAMAFYSVMAAANEPSASRDAEGEALSFLGRYPDSPYRPYVADLARSAQVEDGDRLQIASYSVCEGNVFRLANWGSTDAQATLSADDVDRYDLAIPAGTELYVRYGPGNAEVKVYAAGRLASLMVPNESTCSTAVLRDLAR